MPVAPCFGFEVALPASGEFMRGSIASTGDKGGEIHQISSQDYIMSSGASYAPGFMGPSKAQEAS